jgi:hypothetical protein
MVPETVGAQLTVLAGLIFVVTERAVQGGELAQLVALEFVLAFGNGRRGLDDVVNQFLRFVDFLFRVGHDQAMKVFFLVAGVSCVRSTLAFLDRTFATNGDFGARFCFHFLQGIATRSDE